MTSEYDQLFNYKIFRRDDDPSFLRPDFGPNQIRGVHNLKSGSVFWDCRKHLDSVFKDKILLTTNPYPEIDDGRKTGDWLVNYKRFVLEGITNDYEETLSLRDLSVIPSSQGFWNSRNWLEKIQK